MAWRLWLEPVRLRTITTNADYSNLTTSNTLAVLRHVTKTVVTMETVLHTGCRSASACLLPLDLI